MLGSAVCPAMAWQQGWAWIAEVGDPMIHFFCQVVAAWPTLRHQRAGAGIYLLLAPFAAFDLLGALFGEANIPLSQLVHVPLLVATALWATLAMPDSYYVD